MSTIARSLALVLATLLVAVGALTVRAQPPEPSLDPSRPAPFTGRIAFGGQVRGGVTEAVDGHIETRGNAHAPSMVSISDPRLDGDVLISFQTDEYVAADGTGQVLGSGTWHIQTEDGVWEGSYIRLEAEGLSDHNTVVLVGQGAYEGLVAVWEQTIDGSGWDIAGAIFGSGPPPATVLP